MSHSCITCTSSRTLSIGPRAGSLWCFVKRIPVNPESACQSYPEAYSEACNRHGAAPSQRVLVKSAGESQFETTYQKTDHVKAGSFLSLQSVMYPEGA